MPVEPTLNAILKEMWRLDEKLIGGDPLVDDENKFYTEHLKTITDYYLKNSAYWQDKNQR